MSRRTITVWLTALAVVVVSGCAGARVIGDAPDTQDEAAAKSADGLLDCDEGQVHRDAGISVTGETEQQVVAAALAGWTDHGAEVVGPLSTESWVAALNGRDVAVAYPELNGDGSWTVHDVRTCGEPDVGPESIDGSLDCANESIFSVQGSIDPSATGLPTAEEAVRDALRPYEERFGGETVLVDSTTGSLVIGEREQVVARATEAPAGGWIAVSVSGCEGYSL